MSRRENASSPLKLQPPIYYVYVYKSLRRPHIPEACEREREERKIRKRKDRKEGLIWRCVKCGQNNRSRSFIF